MLVQVFVLFRVILVILTQLDSSFFHPLSSALSGSTFKRENYTHFWLQKQTPALEIAYLDMGIFFSICYDDNPISINSFTQYIESIKNYVEPCCSLCIFREESTYVLMKKFKLLCKIMQSSLNAISLNFRYIENIEI